jgi:hypothetical protein
VKSHEVKDAPPIFDQSNTKKNKQTVPLSRLATVKQKRDTHTLFNLFFIFITLDSIITKPPQHTHTHNVNSKGKVNHPKTNRQVLQEAAAHPAG